MRNEKCTFLYIARPNKANNRQRNVTSVTLLLKNAPFRTDE